MPYFQRFFVSVVVIFVLLFSLCALPAKISARKACPVEIPDSLLTLYLKSDLVIVASIESERFLKTVEEYEYGSTFEEEKNLQIFDTLKGRRANSAAFREFGFKPKNLEETDESSDAIYPQVGEKALFFLEKDAEENCYRLTDGESGAKRLDAAELDIYVERIEQLKRITASRKNQLGKLTEWLVRLVEEPVTRDEGLIDLQGSFGALEYEREDTEAAEEEAKATKKTIVLDKDFRAENTSEIAKLLTDSQKQRLSNAVLISISNDLFKLNNSEIEEEIAPEYGFINLAGNWDKTYLAMSAFAFLQNAEDSDRRRITYLMDVITHVLGDDELYTISSEYQSALAGEDNALTEFSVEETFETEIVSTESETPVEAKISTENKEAEPVVQEVKTEIEEPEAEEIIKQPAAKLTYKQYREKLFAKFGRQYGTVISQISASR